MFFINLVFSTPLLILLHLLHKVEDEDDIKNVPSTAGSGPEDNASEQNVTHEKTAEEANSVKINTSDLPPHMVLDMPALSPTMV